MSGTQKVSIIFALSVHCYGNIARDWVSGTYRFQKHEVEETTMKWNQSYTNFFQSIIDQDRAAVVICNPEHEIIYMNPAAVLSYEKWGGES